MNLTQCCTNNQCTCSNPSVESAKCYIAGIPSAYVTEILDIHWDGSTELSLVRNLQRPNLTSFILDTDTLPLGYSFDAINRILYFPPNVSVSNSQFAVWTNNGQDSCDAYIWTAESVCVSVESGRCVDIQP